MHLQQMSCKCIMPLAVLVRLLYVVVGGMHVCISLQHAASAKVVKGVVVADDTGAPLGAQTCVVIA